MNKFNGYIKLHRAFLVWEHFGEPSVALTFIALLLTANRAGVSTASLDKLERFTHFSRPTIIRALRVLTESGEIVREKKPNKTMTKIVNFAKYQSTQRGENNLPPRGKNILPPNDERGKNNLPPTPLYIKQESTKESENAHARANAKVLDDFLNGGISLEAFCKNNRIAPDECRRLAEAIVNEWDISGRQHRDESDAKEHLMTLIRNRHKAQSNGNDSNNDEPHGPNPLDRARVITVRV